VVATRDPNRPHTKTDEQCGTQWAVGIPRGGGRSFLYLRQCTSWGCPRGAEKRAIRETEPIRARYPAFVGIDEVSRWVPAYGMNADKVPGEAFWVTLVPTPPENAAAARSG